MSTVPPMLNVLSIDVEDWYQVAALAPTVPRDSWATREGRVERSVERLLELLARRSLRATFFVLGWTAERHPRLVPGIVAAGHEIGSHGWSHRNIYEQSPAEFREETLRSRRLLQDQSGQPVTGYRAASFSVTAASLWALDVLIDAGFDYDSSVFPIRHDRYGLPGASTTPGRIAAPSGRTLVEFPMSTAHWLGQRVPVCGGGYFRILPYGLVRRGLRQINAGQGQPFCFYLHPWEIDPGQPGVPAGAVSRFRHYTGLERCERRLERLLGEFRFGTMREVLADLGLVTR
jgi:polysaccharide deacetylase family protein (PEP-CTERM system associated)